MLLQDRIKAAALPLAEGRRIADVRIGLGYTAVLLDSGQAGVAYTSLDEACGRLLGLPQYPPPGRAAG